MFSSGRWLEPALAAIMVLTFNFMSNILIGIWLILFGVMALFSSKVPDWVVPVAAIGIGLIVLAGGWRGRKE